jgi:SAM-dependent methyltransferase
MDAYSNRVFDASQIEAAARSAAFVVPTLCNLFPWVRSVVDVGCGTGTWLHEFELHGVPKLLGLESGDIPARLLQIEPSQFRIADFGGSWVIEDRFDLALSLEIAQQLPPGSVENFITQLARLSDVIVFSPAVPAVNGQLRWDERGSSFWVAHFELVGYECFDLLRNIFWYEQRVEWGYSQNILIFIAGHRADLIADLRKQQAASERPLDVVHPRAFQTSVNSEEALRARSNAAEERGAVIDAQLRQSEERGAMLDAQLRQSGEQCATLDARLRQSEERGAMLDAQLRQSEERDATFDAQLRNSGVQCAMLQAQLGRSEERSTMLAVQLGRIESSMTWRGIAFLRRSLERRPKLRSSLRRTAKLVWWTATGRLSEKFKQWRRTRNS